VKRLVIEYWLPLLVWLVIIFFFSTDAFAADKTAGLIYAALRLIAPGLSQPDLQFWHMVIRKCGHISEYFILAIFTHRTLRQDQPDLTRIKLRTLCFAVLAAAFDEYHQSLTLFRTASPIDVSYDCLGAVWALWLITTNETRRLRTRSFL
jgi:VanZ family protein